MAIRRDREVHAFLMKRVGLAFIANLAVVILLAASAAAFSNDNLAMAAVFVMPTFFLYGAYLAFARGEVPVGFGSVIHGAQVKLIGVLYIGAYVALSFLLTTIDIR